jgi:TPP-dependent 2-oxoacid decarboxylase
MFSALICVLNCCLFKMNNTGFSLEICFHKSDSIYNNLNNNVSDKKGRRDYNYVSEVSMSAFILIYSEW